MRGRPAQFDPELARQAAMEVFWSRGYTGTSVSDLLSATDLSRSSLYQTFTSKEALYHAGKVFAAFYRVGNAESMMLVIAVVELAIILAFVLGLFKRWSYGLVLVLHAVSTLASYPKYLAPWDNQLFFCSLADAGCLCCFIPAA